MILTVTPNAAVDKTFCIAGFSIDCVNRPSESNIVAGGKGINVARVYHTLGGKSITTGFLAGVQGDIIRKALAEEGIPAEFVTVEGESRICIAIIDPLTGTQTEINESGPTVSAQDAAELLESVEELMSRHRFDFVLLCGSLPPGAPEDLYAQLIATAQQHKIRCVLDTSGAALRAGVEAKPWMVKPNLVELQGLVGTKLPGRESVLGAIRDLHCIGIEMVAVTLGARGAIASYSGADGAAQEAWEAIPLTIEFVSAVASGDSFLAAFIWSWNRNNKSEPASLNIASNLEQALRLGTGAGAANAAVIGAGFCTKLSIEDAARGTQTRRIRAAAQPC